MTITATETFLRLASSSLASLVSARLSDFARAAGTDSRRPWSGRTRLALPSVNFWVVRTGTVPQHGRRRRTADGDPELFAVTASFDERTAGS